jgi:polyisoprenyl-phosphate glycosyltransferase
MMTTHIGLHDPTREVSVVVALLKEEENLANLPLRMSMVPGGLGLSCEIALVDEGSRDDAARLIDGLTQGDPRAAILQPRRGFGHLPADSAGLGDA